MTLALLLLSNALAIPTATCSSCAPGGDESRTLLYRERDDDPLVLEWRGALPEARDGGVHLFAGNPSASTALRDRGAVGLDERAQGVWRVEIPAGEVGRGTFIAALVAVDRKGRPERILSWEVFRLLTADEHAAQNRGPAPHAGWEIDVTPSVLRARRGGVALPRGEGEQVLWWSLLGQPLTDLDLDGASTGLPGLSVQIAAPWRAGSVGLDDRLRGLLDEVDGHQVRFAPDFHWTELPDRVLDGAETGQRIVHYYTVLTLHTNASTRSFEARELLVGLGLGERSYFAHETSANLGSPPDPRLWSGYSERELSEDPDLLTLIARQIGEGHAIEGLPTGIGQMDGDGGSPAFELGLIARISAWDKVTGGAGRAAVIEAVDVVATRAGLAIPSLVGQADEPGALSELQRLFTSPTDEAPLNLGQPPQGWRVALPMAERLTRVGTLRLERGKPALAQRMGNLPLGSLFTAAQLVEQREAPTAPSPTPPPPALPPENAESLDAQARFVVGADLRAGALIREATLRGRTKALVPLDAWAQLALQITVRVDDGAEPTAASAPIVEREPGRGATIPAPARPPGLIDGLSASLGVSRGALGVGVGVLALIAVLLLLHLTGLGRVIARALQLLLSAKKPPPEQ